MDDPKRPPRCEHEPEDENAWAKSLIEKIADSAEGAEDQPKPPQAKKEDAEPPNDVPAK